MVEQHRLGAIKYYWVDFDVLGKLSEGYEVKHGEGIGDGHESRRHKLVIGAAKQLFEQCDDVRSVDAYRSEGGITDEKFHRLTWW